MKQRFFATPSTSLWALASFRSSAFQRPSFPARLRTFGRPLHPRHTPTATYTNDFFLENDNGSVTPFGRISIKKSQEVPSARRFFPGIKRVAAALVPILVAVLSLSTGPNPAHAASAIRPQRLGWWNLWSSTVLLISIGALPLSFSGLGPFARILLVSAIRCAVQVSLLGSIILQRIMGVKQPACVAAWILGVGFITGRECVSRIQYSYPGMKRNTYLSIVTGGLVVLSLTLSLKLFGNVQPWFDPRTWIPIAGMLFGNTLNAAALGAASITKQFATESDSVELRLMRGASTREAILPLLEESYRTSLMPTINSLAAAGIIHIPGMMSGQILAGQSPQQAALYQIVINFLIATTALLTVQLVIHSSIRAIVDTRERRLRSGILEPKRNGTTMASLKSIFSFARLKPRKNSSTATTSNPKGNQFPTLFCKKLSSMKGNGAAATHQGSNEGNAPVLAIQNLEVARANVKIDLALQPGDRIAVNGKSGSGKSQILRTIVALEESGGGESRISLFGNLVLSSDLPGFRSRVSLVPQTNPTLEGTPNEFYEQIIKCQSQQQQHESMGDPIIPSDIASKWDLGTEAFDQPWRTLSGGESQRAALAIALALKPDVLLLDESMGSLDDATSMLVEGTLRKSNIPMIIVTHSEEQLGRFCTHRLDLQ